VSSCPHEKRKNERRLLMIGSENTRTASSTVRQIAPVVFLTAALAVIPSGPASAAAPVHSGPPISLELVDADLQRVLTAFAEATGFVFAADARTVEMGGLDRLVTVDYEQVPWDQALDEILIAAGLTWTLEGKVLWIHLPDSGPDGDRNFTGDAIDLRLEDAKLADVLHNLAKVTGLGIDFDPDIETTVSVALRSVPWDQVLDLILRISGFEYTNEEQSIEVFRVTDTKGMQFISASSFSAEG
jgi:type II secretory pathway component HofQ